MTVSATQGNKACPPKNKTNNSQMQHWVLRYTRPHRPQEIARVGTCIVAHTCDRIHNTDIMFATTDWSGALLAEIVRGQTSMLGLSELKQGPLNSCKLNGSLHVETVCFLKMLHFNLNCAAIFSLTFNVMIAALDRSRESEGTRNTHHVLLGLAK